MSRAFQKNRAALARLLGNDALAERLLNTRIGVWSDVSSDVAAGRLIAEALGDTLARLWQRLDVTGPLEEVFGNAARQAAASAGYQSEIEQRWQPPYDVVVAIGTDPPDSAGMVVRVGASGWVVSAGTGAHVDDDPNPVGPTLAAGCAGSEVFKIIFADALSGRAGERLGDLTWSAWSYGADLLNPRPMTLDVSRVQVLGAGAVTHGFAWALTRWPAKLIGQMDLIDPDAFDQSNAQRYAGLAESEIGQPKAEALAARLRNRIKDIDFVPHPTDMNTYFASLDKKTIALAIAGLDSPEARRQLALKLPKRTINMWTEGFYLGAARFGFGDQIPCLFCAYPEPVGAVKDEVGEIYQEIQSTLIMPWRIRELLDTSASLTAAELHGIAGVFGLDANALAGKPLRSIRGILCATGKVQIGNGAADTDVPLAHASLMAGVFGFVEFIHELSGVAGAQTRWAYSTLHPPRHGFLELTTRRTDCYLCGDEMTRRVAERVHGRVDALAVA